jgi:hypothetical protein
MEKYMRVVMKVLKLMNGFIFILFFGDESVCGVVWCGVELKGVSLWNSEEGRRVWFCDDDKDFWVELVGGVLRT